MLQGQVKEMWFSRAELICCFLTAIHAWLNFELTLTKWFQSLTDSTWNNTRPPTRTVTPKQRYKTAVAVNRQLDFTGFRSWASLICCSLLVCDANCVLCVLLPGPDWPTSSVTASPALWRPAAVWRTRQACASEPTPDSSVWQTWRSGHQVASSPPDGFHAALLPLK